MRQIILSLSFLSITLFIFSEAYGQSVSVGGRLYDKWWSQAGVDEPGEDQPLWANQSSNTRDGSTTWRCKECHGWDYKGAAGAYSSGSHSTGFPGVMGTLSESDLIAWLDGTNNNDHDFSAMGTDQFPHLARFLSEGLVDVTPLIDAETKAAIGGDRIHGQELYEGLCANTVCHGADGTAINFSGDPEDPEFLGTIASGNPWEFIHKTRVGHPASDPPMPATIDLGWIMADVVDVLDYAQTLPVGVPVPTPVEPLSWGGVKKEITE